MPWFDEWFDTPLYEQLYAHRDTNEAAQMADLIEAAFPPFKYPVVLDLACGRGRHSFNLARKGYQVTGVDLSPNAIAKAQKNTPVDVSNPPEFHVHDMREALDIKFDLVVNLFTSFGYFENDDENKLVIKQMAAMLKSGGALVIDFLNPDWVKAGLVPHETHQVQNYTVDINRFIENGMVNKIMRFTQSGSSESQTFQERVKLFNADWFEEQFNHNGLSIISRYGNYDGEKYQDETSSRMIFFAVKSQIQAK